MSRVLLAGYYGYGNAGDEALLEVLAGRLQAAGHEVAALSGAVEATEREYGVKAFPHKRPSALLKAVRWAEAVVFGGGGLLQNATSSASLVYYLGLLETALRFKRPVAFYAQGVGPLRGVFARQAVARVLHKVQFLSVREAASRKLLLALDIPGERIELTACPSLLLEPADEARVDELEQIEGLPARPWVLVSLRGVPALWRKAREVAEGLMRLQFKRKVQPVFVPFQQAQDEALCWQVRAPLHEHGGLVKAQYKPSELLGLFGRAEAVCATRLHALLFAANRQVPALALPYAGKVAACAELLQAQCFELESLEAFALRDALERVLEDEAYRALFRRKAQEAKAQAEEGLARLLGWLSHLQ